MFTSKRRLDMFFKYFGVASQIPTFFRTFYCLGRTTSFGDLAWLRVWLLASYKLVQLVIRVLLIPQTTVAFGRELVEILCLPISWLEKRLVRRVLNVALKFQVLSTWSDAATRKGQILTYLDWFKYGMILRGKATECSFEAVEADSKAGIVGRHPEKRKFYTSRGAFLEIR